MQGLVRSSMELENDAHIGRTAQIRRSVEIAAGISGKRPVGSRAVREIPESVDNMLYGSLPVRKSDK